MIYCVGTTPVYQRTMTFCRVVQDGVNRTAEVADYASGKSVNVARVLHVLGEKHLAIGFAGGARGEELLADMRAAGICHDFVQTDAPTRQCITVIDDTAGTATELVEESRAVPPAAWVALGEKLDRYADATVADDIWIFSGTLPPGAPSNAYSRLLPGLISRGARIVADLSGAALLSMMEFGNVLVKVNQSELDATLHTNLEPGVENDRIEKELERGNRFVITLGKNGALAVESHGTWIISPPAIKAISAVGSGDSFAAGMCAGLSRGESLVESCRLAAACGAANALTPHSGHLRKADVEGLLSQVDTRLAE